MNPLKHILICNNIYPPIMAGGAELIVAYLAEGLAARGNKVTVISTCGPEMEPYPVEQRNGVEVIRFFPKNLYWHWTRGNQPAWKKALWHLRDAWNTDAGFRFRAILAAERPDVLHTHLIDGLSAIVWRRAKEAGIPVLHTAHDYHLMCPRSLLLTKDLKPYENGPLPYRLYRKWHMRTTRDVDLFCSPSKFLIEKHKQAGLQACDTAVVANGIPLPKVARGARDTNAPVKFLFAARHMPEKGCEVLMQAIRQLPADANYEIWVAGKGMLEEEFRQLVTENQRVKLLGYIKGEQKEEIFRQADCMIIPSLWYENAPVVIVEAAAYGMGIIGSRIGAIPEFIEHERTGLLFEPGNASALSDAMQRIIHRPEQLQEYATNAKTLVERSSVEQMVENYVAKYQALIA